MKKLLLIFTAILLIHTTLTAQQPVKELESWAARQTGNINAGEVVEFLNGGRAAGDITFGGGCVYDSARSDINCAARLDEDNFVVAYQHYDNNYGAGIGTVVIGTVTGNNITYGAKYVFNSAHTPHISIVSLDASHFVVVYQDNGNYYYGTARVATVTNGTVIFGSEYIFNYSSLDFLSASTLDQSHFIISYKDYGNSNFGTTVLGTVSGSSISFSQEYIFNGSDTRYCSSSGLDATSFVIAYIDVGNSQYGTAIIGTVTGNSIAFGSEYVFEPTLLWDRVSVSRLNESKFIIAYSNYSNSRDGTAIIGTVNGNVITFGLSTIFNYGWSTEASVSAADEANIVISFDDGLSGSSIAGLVSGTIVNFNSKTTFDYSNPSNISCASLNTSTFIVCYRPYSLSGTAIVGKVEIPTPTPTVPISNWPILLAVVLMGAVLWKRMM